jgi:hypothetical protein
VFIPCLLQLLGEVAIVVAMAADKEHRQVLQALRDGLNPGTVVFTQASVRLLSAARNLFF